MVVSVVTSACSALPGVGGSAALVEGFQEEANLLE